MKPTFFLKFFLLSRGNCYVTILLFRFCSLLFFMNCIFNYLKMAAIAETVWQYQQQYESALDAFFEFKATGKVASVRVESGTTQESAVPSGTRGIFSIKKIE